LDHRYGSITFPHQKNAAHCLGAFSKRYIIKKVQTLESITFGPMLFLKDVVITSLKDNIGQNANSKGN
jgi:hypothetical protein